MGISEVAAREHRELGKKYRLEGAALSAAKSAKIGDLFPCASANVKKLEAAAPRLLSESDLLDLMEKNGIGTDASMPGHIQNIVDRGYTEVVEPGRRLQPTMLGCAFVKGLLAIDRELVRPTVRARIEKDVSDIAKQRRSHDEVVESAVAVFRDKCSAVRTGLPRLLAEFKWTRKRWRDWIEGDDENCSISKGSLVEYWSKSNKYWVFAKVLGSNDDGTFDLSVKSKVKEDDIRIAPDLRQEEELMYCNDRAKGTWVEAKVEKKNDRGNYTITVDGKRIEHVKVEYCRRIYQEVVLFDDNWNSQDLSGLTRRAPMIGSSGRLKPKMASKHKHQGNGGNARLVVKSIVLNVSIAIVVVRTGSAFQKKCLVPCQNPQALLPRQARIVESLTMVSPGIITSLKLGGTIVMATIGHTIKIGIGMLGPVIEVGAHVRDLREKTAADQMETPVLAGVITKPGRGVSLWRAIETIVECRLLQPQ